VFLQKLIISANWNRFKISEEQGVKLTPLNRSGWFPEYNRHFTAGGGASGHARTARLFLLRRGWPCRRSGRGREQHGDTIERTRHGQQTDHDVIRLA
jgi:hypothetical protein